jgi:DNA-binding LytR/AlgR family response regulator
MNCIIVDDKNSATQLEEYVSKYSSIKLVGTFNDPASAMDLLSTGNNIDLIFLDLKLTGLESLETIGNLKNNPTIIVVSLTDEYAIRAFDYNVADYLLKPVAYSRFCRAVDKTLRFYMNKSPKIQDRKEIYIKKGNSLIKLKIRDIIFIEGLENYVTLFINQEKYVIHFTMKAIENQLPSDMFIRIHKSYIVNKNNIKKINENSLDLTIGNDRRSVPVGLTYRESMLNKINVMNK